MEIKKGVTTSEFQMTAITTLVNTLLALFVGYGLMTQDLAALWASAILAAIVVIVPLSSALMTKEYTKGRTAVKLGAIASSPISLSSTVEMVSDYTPTAKNLQGQTAEK